MSTIPERFTKNGWHYKLVERTSKGAIYSQSRHPDLPANGKAAAWEVMRVRIRRGRQISTAGGGSYEIKAGEYLPGSNEWGRHGWTFVSLAAARDRLDEISRTLHQKATP